jgi:hypothetical protein
MQLTRESLRAFQFSPSIQILWESSLSVVRAD